MDAIHLKGRITAEGKLEVDLPEGIEPGEVEITIKLTDPDQAWFWTPEWQAAERKADEDLAAGRYKDFATMDDFIADLLSDDDE